MQLTANRDSHRVKQVWLNGKDVTNITRSITMWPGLPGLPGIGFVDCLIRSKETFGKVMLITPDSQYLVIEQRRWGIIRWLQRRPVAKVA